ncbi:glycine oxidase ThiO [Conexibacter sp. W3-3-2]|nr:glycine oxidase ThiO [Conexibacter sp. W3-3-2]
MPGCAAVAGRGPRAGRGRGLRWTGVSSPLPDVAVLGAGVAGLAVAWRAARHGARVVVLERGAAGAAASHVAAGMLAPVAEADAGERALLALGLDSARRWPAFARELQDATGVDVGYRETGTLVVARDRDAAEANVREAAIRAELGAPVASLLPSQARRLEPALAPTIRGALHAPDDHVVDPRAVVAALLAALRAHPAVELREHAGDLVLRTHGAAVTGVGEVRAGATVLAAGAWSAVAAAPLRDHGVRVPVRPVKGQLLRLHPARAGEPPLLQRVVRFDSGYLVPREDGTVILGATMEEQGFDTQVTALGLHELLRDLHEVVPGGLELAVAETVAGLRPGTPDNTPLLGAHPHAPGLHLATGHHRGGVLLAPVTADVVAAGLRGATDPAAGPAVAPERFDPASVAA